MDVLFAIDALHGTENGRTRILQINRPLDDDFVWLPYTAIVSSLRDSVALQTCINNGWENYIKKNISIYRFFAFSSNFHSFFVSKKPKNIKNTVSYKVLRNGKYLENKNKKHIKRVRDKDSGRYGERKNVSAALKITCTYSLFRKTSTVITRRARPTHLTLMKTSRTNGRAKKKPRKKRNQNKNNVNVHFVQFVMFVFVCFIWKRANAGTELPNERVVSCVFPYNRE